VKPKPSDIAYCDAEIDQRREETLKRMLATPPKPHNESAGQHKKKVTLSPRSRAKPKSA